MANKTSAQTVTDVAAHRYPVKGNLCVDAVIVQKSDAGYHLVIEHGANAYSGYIDYSHSPYILGIKAKAIAALLSAVRPE